MRPNLKGSKVPSSFLAKRFLEHIFIFGQIEKVLGVGFFLLFFSKIILILVSSVYIFCLHYFYFILRLTSFVVIFGINCSFRREESKRYKNMDRNWKNSYKVSLDKNIGLTILWFFFSLEVFVLSFDTDFLDSNWDGWSIRKIKLRFKKNSKIRTTI